jgi:hypothetical protein
MRFPTRREIILGLAVVLAVTGAAWDEWRPTNPEAMRQYRLSRLSDDDLRQLYSAAEKESAELREEALRNRGARCGKVLPPQCADIAFRTRTPWACRQDFMPDCSQPFPTPGAERLFDGYIMGPCDTALAARHGAARRWGCLPY